MLGVGGHGRHHDEGDPGGTGGGSWPDPNPPPAAATIPALRHSPSLELSVCEDERSPVPIIQIPPPYQGPTQGASEVEVDGATLLECLEEVERKYPGFGPLVMDEGGNLRKFATFFRNGDKLTGEILAAALEPGDSIEIISSVAGG